MAKRFDARSRRVTRLLIPALGWALWQAACAGGEPGSGFTGDGDGGVAGADDGGGRVPPGSLGPSDGSVLPAGLHLDPPSPSVDVVVADGVLTANPTVPLRVLTASGAVVPASWSIDRGELGEVDASGVFQATGALGGSAVVTASVRGTALSVPVAVRLHMTENGGRTTSAADAGVPGGIGGVGGEGPGGPLGDPGLVSRLRSESNPLPDLAMLYPYDGTVWPRGLRAPLLQWTTAKRGSAVRVHLREASFDFDGVYSVDGLTDVARQRQPIADDAWTAATRSNAGEPLVVETTIYVPADDEVYGPLKQTWSVAPGALKGTIYYNSYNSRLVGSSAIGAVLALHVGATAPALAVPSTGTKCFACHSMAEDGAYVFAQDNTGGGYSNGAAYQLPSGKLAGSYTGGGDNDRKFLWSGVYPDGAFALTNSRHGREHSSLDSQLFDRATGAALPTTGFADVVKSAVTPAFSGDGRRVVFNFWEGPGASGVVNGGGHSLALMDFDCHAAAGSVACGAPPYDFSNLREIYRDPSRYPGWPGFTPDGSHVVFHNTIKPGGDGDSEIATWQGAQAEIWLASVPTPAASALASALRALDGVGSGGVSYLPRSPQHPSDEVLNYEPTVGPIPSGGYYWVVFTSRRAYGNVAAGDPYETGDGTHPIAKKLWVAAVDLAAPAGVDPSHPAFYLPGQELNAGNMRGYWAADPCAPNGDGCASGDECCSGFCRAQGEGGAPVCSDQPPGCAREFEKCSVDGDCCGASEPIACVNGRCARLAPR